MENLRRENWKKSRLAGFSKPGQRLADLACGSEQRLSAFLRIVAPRSQRKAMPGECRASIRAFPRWHFIVGLVSILECHAKQRNRRKGSYPPTGTFGDSALSSKPNAMSTDNGESLNPFEERFTCGGCNLRITIERQHFEFVLPSGRTQLLRCGLVWCTSCKTIRRFPFITPEPVGGVRLDMVELRATYASSAVCEVCGHHNDLPKDHESPAIVHPPCNEVFVYTRTISSWC
ncbi:MAG: hypothetical protein V4710_17860 [Verrucomicrobiota bacterium]